MDPVSRARNGELDYFKNVSLDVLLNTRDSGGDSLLSIAVIHNHYDCCVEIYSRCPSLIYAQSKHNLWTVMHHAASRGVTQIVEFLISVAAKADLAQETGGGREILPHCKRLCSRLDASGATPLYHAVVNKQAETVKLWIDADPDCGMAGQNPLILILDRSSHDDNSGKMRKQILEAKPSLCKERKAENGWTALHYAAYKGDLTAIVDILRSCPDCCEIVDDEGKNFLHFAVKFDHIKIVKYILATSEIADSIVNAQDNDGNTPLHIAVLSGNETMSLCFLYDPRVNKMVMNMKGQRGLDMITFSYDKRKAGVHGISNRVDQNDLKEQSDFDLVVGALIATVSFAAGIAVPGGYINNGPNEGRAKFSKNMSFRVFVISNLLALAFSLYAVFSHFIARRLVRKEDIIYQLNVAAFCTFGSIFTMMAAFAAGSYTVLANSKELAIAASAICSCFFFFALCALWRMIMQRKYSASSSEYQ